MNMRKRRKVIGMGETIMDIIFHGQQPTAAVPGGSSFNSIISIGRTDIPAIFIGETGNDEIGKRITEFLKANRVCPDFLKMCDNVKSAVSLAFLDEHNDAHYLFYKQPPQLSPDFTTPEIDSEDILQFGSYYAIAPSVRTRTRNILEYARRQNAILYYDLNFRRTHQAELKELLPAIHENFLLADIVRGSADDFEIMYDEREPATIYRRHIASYCKLFICTQGGKEITVCTPENIFRFDVENIHTVSTIGAGDNFNAGFIYGLIRYGIKREELLQLSQHQWNQLIECGRRFAANVCASVNNSIDEEFASTMRKEMHESVTE